MLAICHGCAAIFDGTSDFCPHCHDHSLDKAGRARNLRLARLLMPRAVQRAYLEAQLPKIAIRDLHEIIRQVFQYSDPIDRTALLDLVGEASSKWFRDGKRRR